jgi:hypothetical protein
LLRELDRALGRVDADRFPDERRQEKTHVAESAAEIEHGFVRCGFRERENVAVALAPLARRRRERRDAVKPIEVFVGVEIVSEGHEVGC